MTRTAPRILERALRVDRRRRGPPATSRCGCPGSASRTAPTADALAEPYRLVARPAGTRRRPRGGTRRAASSTRRWRASTRPSRDPPAGGRAARRARRDGDRGPPPARRCARRASARSRVRPRASTRANPSGLTNRQLDVAKLVARGFTNAEIADRLYISPKTADHHVSAVLMKLGTPNRRAVVVQAHDGLA